MRKNINTYLNLCTQVYDLSKPNPPQDAYDFYLSYAKQTNGSILEPMCGSGGYLLPMVADGFNIEGFDASISMLEALKVKAEAKNLNPHTWHGFIEDFNQPKKYKLIFIPSGSFGLITELSDIKKALKIIYEHLDESGFFVFEAETLNAVPDELGIWRGSRWQRPDGKIILLSQLAMLDGEICCSIGKYELVDGNEVIQTEIEEYKIRIYHEPNFLINLLTEAGFSQVRLIKAFDREASPDETDESIIFECKK
ncbi:class I SAM-dependent methyltransferase [Legionella cardiaca]|uniref:Class I SAM-dependent methyltransferase n=1 Tax=Legionella cardiaca TaxID=1071983 RepID=A0ABY8AR72_9GAMM|nr:class I SAM-dependent methyltransferase [Legionella cardiaca]WED42025.1 class I SAM-dependent methyltransferase [Legionella cardiaca]